MPERASLEEGFPAEFPEVASLGAVSPVVVVSGLLVVAGPAAEHRVVAGPAVVGPTQEYPEDLPPALEDPEVLEVAVRQAGGVEGKLSSSQFPNSHIQD